MDLTHFYLSPLDSFLSEKKPPFDLMSHRKEWLSFLRYHSDPRGQVTVPTQRMFTLAATVAFGRTALSLPVNVNPHSCRCLFRCSGKSRASSCWPLSSVSLFWGWLSVSYFYQIHFSFTTHLNQHVGSDTFHMTHVCLKGFAVRLHFRADYAFSFAFFTSQVTWRASPV